MKRSWRKLGFVSSSRRAQSVSVPPHLLFRCRRDFSTTFPALSSEAQDEPTPARGAHNQIPIGHIKARVIEDKRAKLKQSVETRYSDHTQVYEQYIAVVNNVEGHLLPLETHQAVLRACTPKLGEVREYMARSLQERKIDWYRLAHPYETRFEKIMQNIANAGFYPDIKDYHFIMYQFAAVGQYDGIQEYMRRMGEVGLEPTEQTFGILLSAIAHRASLPASRLGRPAIVRELVGLTSRTLQEMFDRRIPPSPASVDLAFRVLSEVYDLKGLTELLRFGYGLDLDYLDSPPTHTTSEPSTSAAGLPQLSTARLPPLSTSFLNALVETLGRWGQISKMVYAFETLTNPLPAPAKTDDTFDDDDDDDFSPIQQEWRPPYAEPNTTTFNFLIKHCIDHRHPALAKHYATQLWDEELKTTRQLQWELKNKPLREVAAPRRGVNVGTLRPIHGFANRNHDVELVRWVIRACTLAARKKYRSWIYYNQTKSKYYFRRGPVPSDARAAPESPSSSSPVPPPPVASDTPAAPESPSSSSHRSPPSSRLPLRLAFNVTTHLWVLRNEIAELLILKRKAIDTLSNTVTKCKVRLGRRVWDGKDVYMRDKDDRVHVEPETWKKIVNFRERKRRTNPRPQVGTRIGGRPNPARSPRS